MHCLSNIDFVSPVLDSTAHGEPPRYAWATTLGIRNGNPQAQTQRSRRAGVDRRMLTEPDPWAARPRCPQVQAEAPRNVIFGS